MPLDHYVSQVHLKKFYSPRLPGLMHAIRKTDLKRFTPRAYSVCRVEDGSTNRFLPEARVIEEFLKDVERNYNAAISKLEADKIDSKCVFVIAGFVAYVIVCSPAGMRIQADPFKSIVEETTRRLDARGSLPRPPAGMGCDSFTELLERGKVGVQVDPKFPQAMGIATIYSHIKSFGNFEWDILINPFADSPFFTSDFPVAIETTKDPRFLNRIVPLAPNLAIRIRPDLSIDREYADFSFPGFRHKVRELRHSEVVYINTLIVRCAETTVFFRDDQDWIPRFVQKNAGFRIEPRSQKIPAKKGMYFWYTQEISSC